MTKHNGNPDILIIGSGMGGASLANALSGSGLKVQVLERGDYIPRDHRNWDPKEVFHNGIYRSGERWIDRNGRQFEPNQHYCVGGSTKMYGACLMRFRPQDFQAVEHYEGISPAWPIDYELSRGTAKPRRCLACADWPGLTRAKARAPRHIRTLRLHMIR